MHALLPCGACVLALRFAPALRALELGEPLFQSVGDADSIPDRMPRVSSGSARRTD